MMFVVGSVRCNGPVRPNRIEQRRRDRRRLDRTFAQAEDVH